MQTFHDNNLVLVVLGDHQPATIVSGTGANHDVPISIIAHDPAVLDRISSWGWQGGLLPSPQAPVWRMDAFRDRFLAAFGPHPPTAPPGPGQYFQRAAVTISSGEASANRAIPPDAGRRSSPPAPDQALR